VLDVIRPLTIGSPDGADHFVRFYDRDAELLDEVCDHLDAALRAGGLAVAIATRAHCAELARRLGGFGGPVGTPGSWFTGRVVFLDAAETLDAFMVDGQPDAQRFAAVITPVLAQAAPGKPVHAFGEMVAILCERGAYDAALALELLWNELADRQRFSLFCGYAKGLFASPERSLAFRHICAAHTRVTAFTELLPLQAEVERRKEAERTLRQRELELAEFLDNASEGIHKVAADGTILYANRAELEMLGYAWEEYVGRNIAEFYVDAELAADILCRLQEGEVLRDQPATMRCRDGSAKPVLIYSNGYFEGPDLVYTRCFTRDASERVAHDREREQLLESVREASRAKDEFLAMLGHELRNPLSPIVTALQLMRMRGDTATAREQAIIQRQVEHMVRLVDDLLDTSRITRGKIELKRERAQLSAVLAKAIEQASVLLEQRSHRLHIDADPQLQCEGDPVRLAQVVSNLLTNAARYTEAGGDIHLRAWRRDADTLSISVRDNGMGIDAAILPRVFDLFYQGHRSIDRAEGGLGIGLALVRSLVELHGGSVEARSEGSGRGSEFVVVLPCIPIDAANDVDVGPASAPAHRPMAGRVLLVDDNGDAADTMATVLRHYGYDVHVFTDPVAALAQLPQLHPHVAILDIGLPVLDGYELGARIRESFGSACKLIALTGYGQESDHARSEAAGFDHHLVKPIAPEALIGVLARVA